ncbi:TIGR02679 domain-containing protein [Streptomyces sp. NBC_00273]|nr:TIGR02679 domain-containing protein [Streptomyces sp. NBC_00273]
MDALARVHALPPRPRPLSLACLAHHCARNPHCFDLKENGRGALLVLLARDLLKTEQPDTPTRKSGLLTWFGIVADRLSQVVLLIAAHRPDQPFTTDYSARAGKPGVSASAVRHRSSSAEKQSDQADSAPVLRSPSTASLRRSSGRAQIGAKSVRSMLPQTSPGGRNAASATAVSRTVARPCCCGLTGAPPPGTPGCRCRGRSVGLAVCWGVRRCGVPPTWRCRCAPLRRTACRPGRRRVRGVRGCGV